MDLPGEPKQTWQDIRHNVRFNNSIEWVQQNQVPPVPYKFDTHTDVLPGVRVHHKSRSRADDIAIWEPRNTNFYIITQYRVIKQILNKKDEIPESVLAVLLLAGGAVVAKALWKVLTDLADTSSTADGVDGDVHQRPTPENRQYNVFISHSWNYHTDYQRTVDFLDSFEELDWQNHSVPLNDPLDTINDAHLRARLRDQMQTTSIVLILAGMYSAHSEWIQEEIELANDFEKPVVGIRPYGAEKTPNVVEEVAIEMVGWRQNSVVRAIVEHAV